MSLDEFAGFENLSDQPLEVRLVSETTECRSCDWFWKPPPYGPYPSFDFKEDYPEILRERTSKLFQDKDLARSVPGLSRGQAIANPQILHGCRKSPVMTIGINPNLTGFWPGPDGARWAYPLFSNFKRYAYYYRHRTTHQESFSLDFVKKHFRTDGEIKVKKSGYLKSAKRDMAARQMEIKLVYDDGSQDKIEQKWDPKNHFVLLIGPNQSFQSGDVIGGFIDLPEGVEVPVQQNVVGYYQRVIPILEQVSAWLRSQQHLPNLQMGEDICQLDMVACASPGWGKVYKIDKKQVIANCVHKNAWVIKQLIQSNPKVIVFSGRSAFQMFNDMFKPFVSPNLADNMDVYGLMKMTARDPHYLDIQTEVDGRSYHLRSRIIISPHFSYDDNFASQARLSSDEMDRFSTRYPDAYAALQQASKKIEGPNRDGYFGIATEGLKDWVANYPVPAIPLMQELFEPSTMIGAGIAQEIMLGNVGFDHANNHLKRSEGPCRFCVNSQWSFPEGCPYKKPDEPDFPDDFLDNVVRDVTKKMFAAPETVKGHPNENLIRKYVGAAQKNDVETLRTILHDDVVMHFFGHNPVAGVHEGREATWKRLGETWGPRKLEFKINEIVDLLVNDDRAVLLMKVQISGPEKTVHLNRADVYRIVDGKIVELWVYDDDPYKVDELFAD